MKILRTNELARYSKLLVAIATLTVVSLALYGCANAANSDSQTQQTPAIAGISPVSGAVGISATIAGTNFGATQGGSTVTFNGIAATVTSWSGTSITVTVPTGATTGNVVVTVGGQVSNGVSFTVTVPAPTITSLNPNSGAAGTSVIITGTNFGTTQGTSTVTFNGTAATATSWSGTSITVTVPTGATTGNVVVTVGGQVSNGVSFTVTVPAPTITSLNPNSGAAGTSVIITGTNFGTTQGTSTVTFNGTAATATSWSGTSITVTVPTGATTGNVVATVGGQVSNGFSFAVTVPAPTITSLNPNSGAAGTSVIITGTNFGTTQGTSTVTFNGTAATATSWSGTSITVTVPTGATTGNVVATVGGQVSNGFSFAVTVPAPTITSLDPNSGAAGTSVIITGTNFGTTQGTSTVTFNGTAATATSWSGTSITVTVPTGATTGNVVATVGGQVSNGFSFAVTVPAPTITSLNPNSGAAGTSVIITGTNFGTTQGTSTVTFNGTAATATSWSGTSIAVTVPTGATTGNVVVTVGGQASNGVSFTVLVSIELVQHGATDNGSSSSSTVVVTLSGVASGHLLTCSLTYGNPGGTTLSVSDNVNGAWSVATAAHFNSVIGQTTAQFYLANSKAGTATITGVPASAGEYGAMNCQEWSGVATSSPLDQTMQQDGTTPDPSSGSVTTTASGELILGDLENGYSPTAGTGFSLIDSDTSAGTGTGLNTEYQIQASAGSIAATWTLAPASWTAQTATFKAASGAGGTSPSITSLSPTSGLIGTSVTITGTNFGATQGTSVVKFNGTAATATSWSGTSITATVPTGATTGNVVVTVNGLAASNGVNFTVTVPAPTITSLNPNSGAVGASVTITGTNFGTTQGASTVKFNGTTATVATWSTTSITVTVPTGATTGNVVVTVGGQASNGVNFTVSTTQNITVTVSPKRAGLTITQTLSVTPTTNDTAGVNWSATAGSFSAPSSLTGVPVTYTAPSTAGTYTITATSATDNSKSASFSVGVTDLAAVATYHNNLSRDGTNPQEYALSTSSVTSSTFGKLFSCTIDAPAYAQPLWVPNLAIGGGTHNVVFVASTHDTVYAFDADKSPCATYWNKSLLNSGETYLSNGDVGTGDIEPDIGIIGTPVIDLSTKTLYVVSKSKASGTSCTPSSSCFQRLHALSLIDGSEKFGGPYSLTSSITVPGTGDGSSNGSVPFDPLHENQRPGLALVNGVVYIAWASHGDNGPYHGWVIGFAANNIGAGPSSVWNSTPNFVSGSPSDGGIWMSGGAPAADSSNDLYFLTGNGSFDANSGGSNYGDSTIRLTASGGLHVQDYFTPGNQGSLNSGDADHGAGGAAVLVDPSSGPVPHLLIGGGKSGTLFMVNRENLGKYSGGPANPNNVVQSLSVGSGIFATPAFWNNFLYIAGVSGHLNQYAFNTTSGQFALSHSSSHSFAFPGSTPSISSLGTSNAIVWALDNSQYCTEQSPGCGPAVLHAFDATNVSAAELWNSASSGNDSAGDAVKFAVPTVANGKVYVGTRTELTVYGLTPD